MPNGGLLQPDAPPPAMHHDRRDDQPAPSIDAATSNELEAIAASGTDDGTDDHTNDLRAAAQRQFMEAFAREMVAQRTGDVADGD